MFKFTKDCGWKRYSLVFLYLVVLLSLFTAIIPADALGCKEVKISQTTGPKYLISSTVNWKLTSCTGTTCKWLKTTTEKWGQDTVGTYRQQCYCSNTHKYEWTGSAYTNLIRTTIIYKTYTEKITLPKGTAPS